MDDFQYVRTSLADIRRHYSFVYLRKKMQRERGAGSIQVIANGLKRLHDKHAENLVATRLVLIELCGCFGYISLWLAEKWEQKKKLLGKE